MPYAVPTHATKLVLDLLAEAIKSGNTYRIVASVVWIRRHGEWILEFN